MNVVAQIGHNSLEHIKRRIAAAHDRTVKGGTEWVEGSLEVAAALRDGRDAMPANIAFGDWLKQNALNFYNSDTRTALINMASDPALMREVLTGNDSRSYDRIWRSNKSRFRRIPKTTASTGRTRAIRNPGFAKEFRAMKLGDDTLAKIVGTSLDNADELDELVRLNRGARQGELTPIVVRLVQAAVAGEHVSAIAEAAKMGGKKRTTQFDLAVNWKRRMVASWKLADHHQRIALIERLLAELNPLERQLFIERAKKTEGSAGND